jgi:hypothetical protein
MGISGEGSQGPESVGSNFRFVADLRFEIFVT